MLYLVRHAMVVVREAVPSAQWHLSPEGRAAAQALAAEECWASLSRVYSSAEPKAIATAQRICAQNALPLTVEHAFGEVARPWAGGGAEEYRDLARSYLSGTSVEGWEPQSEATARVRSAVGDTVVKADGSDIAVVAHGLILSLYLKDALGLAAEATAELWSGIGFPDYAVVDPSGPRLIRAFGGPRS